MQGLIFASGVGSVLTPLGSTTLADWAVTVDDSEAIADTLFVSNTGGLDTYFDAEVYDIINDKAMFYLAYRMSLPAGFSVTVLDNASHLPLMRGYQIRVRCSIGTIDAFASVKANKIIW